MNCACGKQTIVIDSRLVAGNMTRRRRKCPKCGKRFSTIECASAPIDAILKLAELVRSDDMRLFLDVIRDIRTDPTLSAFAIRNAWLTPPGRKPLGRPAIDKKRNGK